MKINEIIRQKRIENNLTPEKFSDLLDVSIGDINKWEQGTSYPDITLLPTIARVLNTDVNTLLSFKDNLSKAQVANILNRVSTAFENKGFQSGYEIAINKIKEFPNSDLLLLKMANLIEANLSLYQKDINQDDYKKTIISIYEKVASTSKDHELREHAKLCLFKKLIDRKDYNAAQQILNTLTSNPYFNVREVQIDLYIAKGEFDKAEKLAEEDIYTKINKLHSELLTLMHMAINQNRNEDAKYIANVCKQTTKTFDLWKYNQYVAYSKLYSVLENKTELSNNLTKMLISLQDDWKINESPLYRKITSNTIDQTMGSILQKKIIESIDSQEVINKLKKNPEIREIMTIR